MKQDFIFIIVLTILFFIPISYILYSLLDFETVIVSGGVLVVALAIYEIFHQKKLRNNK